MTVYIAQVQTRTTGYGQSAETRLILGAFASYQTARTACMAELDTFMQENDIAPSLSTVRQYEESFECFCEFHGQACLCSFFATEVQGSTDKVGGITRL